MKLAPPTAPRRGLAASAVVALALALAGPAAARPSFEGREKVRPPGLVDRLATSEGPLRVVVLLRGWRELIGVPRPHDPASLRAVQSVVRREQDRLLAALPEGSFEVTWRYENLLALAGRADLSGVRALAALPGVELVEDDPAMQLHVAEGSDLIGAGALRAGVGGRGVAVAITDSGINYDHVALGNGGFPNSKVIGGHDFWLDDPDPMDPQGHGTGVAGIVAGDPDPANGYFGGVAPEAKLYACKVTNAGGGTNPSTQAAAWDWIITHALDDPANPILLVNASLGGQAFTFACDDQPGFVVTTAAAANLHAAGIALFASSGNSGLCDAVAHPACLSTIISVGAVYDADVGTRTPCISSQSCTGFAAGGCPAGWACRDNPTFPDLVTCYSNGADFLDVLAPSDCARTTHRNGGYRACFNGTSAAAPYAAGAAALVQSQRLEAGLPALGVEELRTLLRDAGEPVTDPKNGITTPRIDLSAIVPPARETECANGVDDDADGLVDCEDDDCRVDGDGDGRDAAPCGPDCDDADPGVHAPAGAVRDLLWAAADRLEWTDSRPESGAATTHQVVRGWVSELPVGAGAAELCLATTPESWLVDAERPGVGRVFSYVVRARNSCLGGRDDYGLDSAGGSRDSTACP